MAAEGVAADAGAFPSATPAEDDIAVATDEAAARALLLPTVSAGLAVAATTFDFVGEVWAETPAAGFAACALALVPVALSATIGCDKGTAAAPGLALPEAVPFGAAVESEEVGEAAVTAVVTGVACAFPLASHCPSMHFLSAMATAASVTALDVATVAWEAAFVAAAAITSRAADAFRVGGAAAAGAASLLADGVLADPPSEAA